MSMISSKQSSNSWHQLHNYKQHTVLIPSLQYFSVHVPSIKDIARLLPQFGEDEAPHTMKCSTEYVANSAFCTHKSILKMHAGVRKSFWVHSFTYPSMTVTETRSVYITDARRYALSANITLLHASEGMMQIIRTGIFSVTGHSW